MYLDLGRERGKVKFTWKELTAIIGLAASLVVHYTLTEFRFEDMKKRTEECEKRLQEIEKRFELKPHEIPPLLNLLILERHNSKEFTVQTENGQAFQITFCQEVDLQRGQKLQVLTYEQLFGCKNIQGPDLGFIAYSDKSGQRINFLERK